VEKIIVTRHRGLLEWLYQQGLNKNIPVIPHVSNPEDIRGKHVYGVLPLSLAAVCGCISEVSMPRLRPDQRGKDLSPSEMDEAGAYLVHYSPPHVLFSPCKYLRTCFHMEGTCRGCEGYTPIL